MLSLAILQKVLILLDGVPSLYYYSWGSQLKLAQVLALQSVTVQVVDWQQHLGVHPISDPVGHFGAPWRPF